MWFERERTMAREIELKYGVNPNQKPARIFMEEGELPLKVLSGRPGYINFLDALNSYQLVSELKAATGVPAAASFKHVSPAGAAIGLPLNDWMEEHFYNAPVVALALIVYGVLFIVIENWRASKREEMAVAGSFGSRAVVSGGRPAGAHFAAPAAATAEDEDDDEDLDFGSITTLEDLSWKTALGIGCFQVLSLVPGTSRSGSTIIGGLLLGCTRSVASKFTFFLAIPVMFGASALKLVKYFIKGGTFGSNEVAILGVGCVVAFVVSLIAIKWLMGFVRRHDFKCFGVYRIILGIVVLAYFFVLEPMLGL